MTAEASGPAVRRDDRAVLETVLALHDETGWAVRVQLIADRLHTTPEEVAASAKRLHSSGYVERIDYKEPGVASAILRNTGGQPAQITAYRERRELVAHWVERRLGGPSLSELARDSGVSRSAIREATAAYGPFRESSTNLAARARREERNQRWVQMRRAGVPVAQIARTEGFSETTVRTVIRPHGPYPYGPVPCASG